MPESKNRRKKPGRRRAERTNPAAGPRVDDELARLAAEGLPGGSTAYDPDAAATAVAQELTQRSRHEGGRESHAPTPTWYKAIMLGLLVAGLLWLIVYYLFQGAYPVPGLGTWNIAVGLVLMMAGLVMTTRWR